jgi:uncharacterized protein (TIGR03437 family)
VIPSPITVSCAQSGSTGNYTYAPNFAQTVSVTSPTSTAFTITDPGVSWLHISSLVGGTASTTAVTFTVQAAGTCNGGVATSVSVHLSNSPNLDEQFKVYLQIVPATILLPSPTSASFSYVKGSGSAGFADVQINSSITSPYFSINDATLPSWLRVSTNSGNAPLSIRFSSTSAAEAMAPGTYKANVAISVSGYGDLTLPISMLLTNTAAQMTIQGPTTVNLNWIEGEAYPTPTITVLSTDTPIAYTATTGGSLGPVITPGEQSGLAYSFGTPIGVSFTPQIFASAAPGSVLTGTVTLTWGNPASTIVVTYDITVVSAGATISSISPSTVANGQSTFSVSLVGTGFVPSTNPNQATTVGIVTTAGANMTIDPAISVSITNQSNISLQFTYPGPSYSGTIPFNTPGSVVIGVCNPVGGVPCQVATASITLNFGTNPIIAGITSSSSLLQTGGVPTLAPYDMISIFGANFCPSCASNQVLTGSPNAVTLTYPASLTFTPTPAEVSAGAVAGTLVVTFQQHSGGTAFTTVNAPLLFATNGQINLTVPSTVPISSLVDIVVGYTPAGGTLQNSAIFPVSIVATDPGIFTVGADGQGSGAILDANYNLVSAANPAGLRSHTLIPGTSDVVSIYMTGLGKPDSLASNTTAGTDGTAGTGLQWSADCVDTGTYLTSFNNQQTGTALTSLDGTLIVTGPLNSGRLIPCLLSGGTDAVSITVGNQPVTNILYAGWVPDTIAGLYQVSFQLPDNISQGFTTEAGLLTQSVTAPTQLPIYITSDSNTTQTGVSIWVAPRLKMTGPSTGSGQTLAPNTMSVTVNDPLPTSSTPTNAVTATGAAGNVTYAITSGLLPSGLSIIPSGTNAGQIVGTPAANTGNPGSNTYTVTVTATDSSTIPVTGTDTFVVTVGDGLYITNTTLVPSTFGTANNQGTGVTQLTASGGVAPYTYSLPGNFTSTTGIAISSTGSASTSGIVSTSASTPAGSYPLVVTALDSTTPTQIQGTSNFTIVVNLNEVVAALSSVTAGNVAPVNSMTTTGNGTGTLTYSLDNATQALVTAGLLSFDTTTGIISTTATTTAGSYTAVITVNSSAIPFVGTANAASAGGTATHSVTFTVAS